MWALLSLINVWPTWLVTVYLSVCLSPFFSEFNRIQPLTFRDRDNVLTYCAVQIVLSSHHSSISLFWFFENEVFSKIMCSINYIKECLKGWFGPSRANSQGNFVLEMD